ncbi:hypothetical protein QU820_08105 [Klebsiella pneumoniae]|uniref:hypothetical protein n=1 Tax=Klebsiella pneumoniae TaxID=573 RepID=UPI002230AE27|nr:hypothetical protein [Klebsiella pneumoniae]MDM9354058.1 hypothetical protein [Klebsiella pneumoniae]
MNSKLTREQLHERARENVKALKMASRQTAFESAREEILADLQLAELALATMNSEPVAWTWHYREQWHVTSDKRRAEFVAKDGDVDVLPLYRHAQQPAPEYPEVLPCPVLLEPGLRFGKGVKTSTMLAALARRAVYESDMTALSQEERAGFQARIEDFKALIAQPVPVVSADLLHTAASAIEDLLEHADPNTSYYSGVWADVPGKLRAAMLAAAQQSPGSEPATVPGKWIPVSERIPETDGIAGDDGGKAKDRVRLSLSQAICKHSF